MNKLATLTFASLASVAFAGQPVVYDSKKTVIPPEPCFAETELQLDIYAAGALPTHNSSDDGFGGGIGLNYYFTRNFGVAVDGTLTDNDNGTWQTFGHLLVRFPIDSGSLCWAPYLKFGGGYTVDGDDPWVWGGGGGVEFRLNPKFGIFAEGGYYWGIHDSAADFTQVKAGVRFIF